ncbi:MAG: carbohydrate binding domain-containing protein [Candidatus Limnocylindrales bacterium]
MTVAEGRPPPAFAGRPGPELVASLLAVVIVAVVGASVLAGGPATPENGPSGPPRASVTPIVATATPIVDPNVVGLLRALNQQLADHGRALRDSLTGSFRTSEVAATIRQINATVQFATDSVSALRGALGEDEAGGRLAGLYQSMAEAAETALGASLENTNTYRIGAGVLVELIADLPALQAELEALARAPVATAVPTRSAPASPTATPTPRASSTPPPATPSPTASPPPSPSLPPPSSASPVRGDQIVNGGFESGVGAPWALQVAPGAAATVAADTVAPAAGKTAARIDISFGSPAYTGISLVQPGLRMDAGAQYTISIAVRAAATRDIRVRIAAADGASYLTRLATATTTWTTQSFTFIAPVSDDAAALQIDFGRSGASVWLDTISFAPLGAPAPSS